jgi:dTMP kinase
MLVCDRYIASSIAYGEANDLDREWLVEIQKFLPPPSLTILLDIAPETAVQRKAVERDRYERDLAMQGRVRESYARLAAAPDWMALDGERPKGAIAEDVFNAVATRLLRP